VAGQFVTIASGRKTFTGADRTDHYTAVALVGTAVFFINLLPRQELKKTKEVAETKEIRGIKSNLEVNLTKQLLTAKIRREE